MKLELVRVYTKDLSLENPLSPAVFGEEWKPEVDMRLHAGGSRLENGLIESVLQVNVEARLGGRPAMVIEAVVGGLFAFAETTDEELARALAVTCPGMLYPYARETVTALSVRGGVPALPHAAGRFRGDLAPAAGRGAGARRLTRPAPG